MSGVVFEVSDETPIRSLADRPLFFCCDACASHFEKNREEIATRRGWIATSTKPP